MRRWRLESFPPRVMLSNLRRLTFGTSFPCWIGPMRTKTTMPFWNRPSLFLSTLDEAFIYRFQDILDQPLLYLSAFFERNKGLYYDNLTFVREKNDLLQWLKYFLVGTAHTAEDAVATLSKILSLRNRLDKGCGQGGAGGSVKP